MYKQILNKFGNHVGHSTIRGLKQAIRRKKVLEGDFIGICPNGNQHHWSITTSGTHKCSGVTIKKRKVGAGEIKVNYAATFLKVSYGKVIQ